MSDVLTRSITHWLLSYNCSCSQNISPWKNLPWFYIPCIYVGGENSDASSSWLIENISWSGFDRENSTQSHSQTHRQSPNFSLRSSSLFHLYYSSQYWLYYSTYLVTTTMMVPKYYWWNRNPGAVSASQWCFVLFTFSFLLKRDFIAIRKNYKTPATGGLPEKLRQQMKRNQWCMCTVHFMNQTSSVDRSVSFNCLLRVPEYIVRIISEVTMPSGLGIVSILCFLMQRSPVLWKKKMYALYRTLALNVLLVTWTRSISESISEQFIILFNSVNADTYVLTWCDRSRKTSFSSIKAKRLIQNQLQSAFTESESESASSWKWPEELQTYFKFTVTDHTTHKLR